MNLDFLQNNLIVHRGLYDNISVPENSLKAFKNAIKKGFVIELDLHLLKDGNVVVFHDDDLNRMVGLDKKIKDFTYDELKGYKLLGTKNYIPLFSDVLKLVNGSVPLLIELKYDSKCGLLEGAMMNLLKDYKGLYAVQSFSPFSLIYMKKHYPNVYRGQLVSDYKNKKMNPLKKWIFKKLFFTNSSKPDFISCKIKFLNNNKIVNFRKDHLVLGWVAKTQDVYNDARNYCDNVICEHCGDWKMVK